MPRCRWHKDKTGFRWLVPGCWHRAVYGDDAECQCPKPEPKARLVGRKSPMEADMTKLKWECLHEERCFRTPGPLFGSIRVERFSDADQWEVLWSVPGYCATLIEGKWPDANAAKDAAETHITAACAALSN